MTLRQALRVHLALAAGAVRGRTHDGPKFFCVGRNKTGTTSLAKAFRELGFSVGDQRIAELLTDKYYFNSDYRKIIDFCRTAQVFQDAPFSYPGTFRKLDAAYPGSKFILTIRDPEQWYASLVRFHSKKFGTNGELPTAQDLKQAPFVRKGYMYNIVRLYGTTDDCPYDKESVLRHYNAHNREVMTYFSHRPTDLLVLDVSAPDAYARFVEFVGVQAVARMSFPWANRS